MTKQAAHGGEAGSGGYFPKENEPRSNAGGEAPSVVGALVADIDYEMEGRARGYADRRGELLFRCRDILAALSPQGQGSSPKPGLPTAEADGAVVGWQPIETAPRDGDVVLIFTPRTFPQVTAGGWRGELALEHWQCVGYRWHYDGDATHWMPLPPAPTPTTGEA